jgi:thiol-disulfide isomerase/thioredoxin
MTHDHSSAQLHVWWALFNLLLAVVAVAVTLWIFVTERGIREEMAEIRETRALACSRRVLVAASPPIVDPEAIAPPQDTPRNGYFGKSGTEIVPVMRLKLEALRSPGGPASQLETLRLGSQDVLPSGSVHIINLWATWCEPCRDEMPDFKALFDRRPDWGKSVRFVPIQLQDPTDPVKAYRELDGAMPPASVKLADRGLNDPLGTALAADKELKLFRGNLPVTLVLDCNRRVRWAQFDQLTRADFDELEIFIDRFRAELEDRTEGSWCTQEWPGNGRCEGRENTPGPHSSVEDCGELKRNPGEAAVLAPPVEAPPPLVECPDDMLRTADGKCKRKLRGKVLAPEPEKALRPATCGNGVCDAGENKSTCCLDCPCEAPLVCRTGADDRPMCSARLKM